MQMKSLSQLKSTISSKLNVKTLIGKLRTLSKRLLQTVKKYASKLFELFTKKPKDKSDYVRVGKFYFSKRFLTIAGLIFVVFMFVFVQFIYPWADGRVWTATVKANSEKYKKFSGKAKIKDKNGFVIYKGQMNEGKVSGQGTQYDLNGNVIYAGSFMDSQYSGKGELYNGKVLIYKGDFAQNLYQGEGQLFDNRGNTIYSGSFALGQKAGKGVEFNPATGLKKYYGDFLNNLREGKGIEYGEDGTMILYEGDFLAGAYSGNGKFYQNGTLKYNGAFANGLYEGEGTLYDIESKNAVYTGTFSNGLYTGSGSLYDPSTKKLLYNGEFEAGYRKGAGELYDKLGSVTFNGDFRDDNIDYISYIGQDVDSVIEKFGKENYRSTVSNRIILTYLGLDTSIIFKEEEPGKYGCEKFVMGTKFKFKGLGPNSTRQEIESVMGKSFSSINFKLPEYYNNVFTDLTVDLRSKKSVPSDKFVMDNYFVRFYYNENKTQIKAIEASSI